MVCSSGYEPSLFGAAFTTAFFGAYRLSEPVALARRSAGMACLRRQDITMEKDQMVIFLRWSKTDQEGKGVSSAIRCIPNQKVCAVHRVKHYLAMRPDTPGPLFMHEDGSCLSKYQFKTVLRAALHQAGLPARQFASNSFRIGAATTAAALG